MFPLPTLMLDKLLHLANARSPIEETKEPIEVTELGMVRLVRPVQPENAYWPIEVTELGIFVFLHPAINVLDEVFIIALQLSRES